MNKKFQITVIYEGSKHLADLRVELREVKNKQNFDTMQYIEKTFVFTASMGIWDKRNDYICCGQILNDYQEYFTIPDIKQRHLFEKIKAIWDLYHLNDTNAGTKKQTEFINKYLKDNNLKYDYNLACHILKDNNLYEDRGYKYGHGWLLEVIPDKILKEINDILNTED